MAGLVSNGGLFLSKTVPVLPDQYGNNTNIYYKPKND